MTKRISRRAALRGAGTIAIGLPWLEAMAPRLVRAAEPTRAKRFVSVYTPGGSVIDNGAGENRWRPVGTETDFTLSPILAPLESIRDKILVVDGLSMRSAVGGIHEGGNVGWLTGTGQQGNGYPAGPSIDQVIASQIGEGYSRASMQMAVRWGTGKSKGRTSPMNVCTFQDNAPNYDPLPPMLDPQAIFDDVFGTLDPDSRDDTAARNARRSSILDYVDHRLESVRNKVSTRDRIKIDEHLSHVRDLEQRLGTILDETAHCQLPTRVDTSQYNPTTGLQADDFGAVRDIPTDESIPLVGQFMMDMLVMALACDTTPVIHFQWSDTEAKHTFPWLGLSEHHHFYQHDGGFRPVECEQIATWYSEQHAYLLTAMDAVDMGGHSLLDESVVFFGSELGHPPVHARDNMPFLLAGRGGGLRSGRFLRNEFLQDRSHNNLLVSILNLFGDERETFGDPAYCSGPLGSLT